MPHKTYTPKEWVETPLVRVCHENDIPVVPMYVKSIVDENNEVSRIFQPVLKKFHSEWWEKSIKDGQYEQTILNSEYLAQNNPSGFSLMMGRELVATKKGRKLVIGCIDCDFNDEEKLSRARRALTRYGGTLIGTVGKRGFKALIWIEPEVLREFGYRNNNTIVGIDNKLSKEEKAQIPQTRFTVDFLFGKSIAHWTGSPKKADEGYYEDLTKNTIINTNLNKLPRFNLMMALELAVITGWESYLNNFKLVNPMKDVIENCWTRKPSMDGESGDCDEYLKLTATSAFKYHSNNKLAPKPAHIEDFLFTCWLDAYKKHGKDVKSLLSQEQHLRGVIRAKFEESTAGPKPEAVSTIRMFTAMGMINEGTDPNLINRDTKEAAVWLAEQNQDTVGEGEEQDFLSYRKYVSYDGASIRRYDEKTGRHMILTMSTIEREIQKSGASITMAQKAVKTIRNHLEITDLSQEIANTIVNQQKEKDKGALSRISFRNGTVHFTENGPVLKPHAHYPPTLYGFDVDYNPNAKCPKTEEFMKNLFKRTPEPAEGEEYTEEEWERITKDPSKNGEVNCENVWRYWGLTMVPDVSFQQMMIIYGQKNTGKSEWDKLLQGCFEYKQDNTTLIEPSKYEAFSIHKLSDPPSVHCLVGKLVAVETEGEVTASAGCWSVIKKIVTGDSVQWREYYYGPQSGRLVARLVVISNIKPNIKAKEMSSVARRLMIIPVTNIEISKPVKDYHKVLIQEEIEGIFARLVRSLSDLYKEGFIVTDESELEKQSLMDENNPIRRFVDEYFDPLDKFSEKKDWLPREEFEDAFRGWLATVMPHQKNWASNISLISNFYNSFAENHAEFEKNAFVTKRSGKKPDGKANYLRVLRYPVKPKEDKTDVLTQLKNMNRPIQHRDY